MFLGLLSTACGEAETTSIAPAQAPITAATATATAPDHAAARPAIDDDRLARLEARLLEAEARVHAAESRAAAAEARVQDALVRGVAAPTIEPPDRTVELRSEDEIKAAATGIDDGAAGPLPVPEVAGPVEEDVRDDPYKAEAFNVDPDPND